MANNQQHNGSNISALSDKNHNGGVGLASLICAIIGFGLSFIPFLGHVLGIGLYIAAIICGIIGLGKNNGFGPSIAGLVIVGVGVLIKYLPMIIG